MVKVDRLGHFKHGFRNRETAAPSRLPLALSTSLQETFAPLLACGHGESRHSIS